MKVVVFASGLGTRINEETSTRPKPIVEIGEKPILWHIYGVLNWLNLEILKFYET